MFTRCPHCSTFFAVSAAQLNAAQGRVRCGTCLSIFDGLKHLTDKSPDRNPDRADFNPLSPNRLPGGDKSDGWQASVNVGAFEAESLESTPPTLEEGDSATTEDVPEVIKEDMDRAEAERRGQWKTTALMVASLILLAALGVQYAWFKPARVLAGYPQARPWLEKFCEHARCSLPDLREPSKIQMLARDVRVHPGYEGALLVSATLVNAASYAQPYPRLQFSVFNVNGQTIASRIFEPEEYLSPDLNPKGDMSPGKPLQIALELIAPEEASISYEFRFL
ncbi:MAG: DUF3426 domain-containing protein [Gammaproteobacteria bacterium]|nr:DUF3426 domain-containing protein [Gammaproteobacteria bacterium]MDH3412793.1 DUF3426 domain-containing protein [Gammaproteobacteria bacterium]